MYCPELWSTTWISGFKALESSQHTHSTGRFKIPWVVGTRTRLHTGQTRNCLFPSRDNEIFWFYFRLAQRSIQSPVHWIACRDYALEESDQSMKLTTHLHFLLRLRMSGGIPPLSQYLHGIQRYNFTFHSDSKTSVPHK